MRRFIYFIIPLIIGIWLSCKEEVKVNFPVDDCQNLIDSIKSGVKIGKFKRVSNKICRTKLLEYISQESDSSKKIVGYYLANQIEPLDSLLLEKMLFLFSNEKYGYLNLVNCFEYAEDGIDFLFDLASQKEEKSLQLLISYISYADGAASEAYYKIPRLLDKDTDFLLKELDVSKKSIIERAAYMCVALSPKKQLISIKKRLQENKGDYKRTAKVLLREIEKQEKIVEN
jgi:hypothetical protein